MTVAEFEARLGAFGESIQALEPTLANIAELVEADLKSNLDRVLNRQTGDLHRSIRTTATDDTLTISMLDYGFYNNFGVLPTPSFRNGGGNPIKIDFGTRNGDYFMYGNREFGLPSRQFFSYDNLQSQIAETIALQITENF